MENPRLVNLFTHSIELEDLILSKYPGKIFENQHHVDSTEKTKLYCFFDLSYNQLTKFLNGKNYEYELRNSKSGEIVHVCQKVNPCLTN